MGSFVKKGRKSLESKKTSRRTTSRWRTCCSRWSKRASTCRFSRRPSRACVESPAQAAPEPRAWGGVRCGSGSGDALRSAGL